MTTAAFQRLIDQQLGSMGRAFGQPFNVYRITPGSNGDFPIGWYKITSQFRAHRNRVRSQDAEVSMTSERVVWYEILGDVSPFWLGDVFIERDAPYFPGIAYGDRATAVPGTIQLNGFALAWHATMRPPLAGRIDCRVQIFRPNDMVMGDGDGAGRWRQTRESHIPLILTNGVFGWGQPGGVASLVPAGFGTSDRQSRGDDMPPDPPGMIPVPRYYCYLPPMAGYTPSEGDAIITEDDARYRVISPYRQDTGVVGSHLMMQRYISQST